MNEFENDLTHDDQMVEISDLDPGERTSHFSRMFEAMEKHPSLHKRFWRFTIASCSMLLVLLVLFGTFPSARGLMSSFLIRMAPNQSTTLITPTATPVDTFAFNAKDEVIWTPGNSSPIVPSATLAPAPGACPVMSQPRLFGFKGAPRVVGSYPVFIIGFGGSEAVLTNFKHAQPPEIGWYRRIFMLTETNYAGTVMIRGGEVHDGTPIWFGMKQHNRGPITTLTVLPLNSSISNHTMSDEEWGLSSATLYIARAGCYFLMATWPQGSWVAFFSAGQ